MSVLTAKRNAIPTITTPLFEQGPLFNPTPMYSPTQLFNPAQMYSTSMFGTTPMVTPGMVAPSPFVSTSPMYTPSTMLGSRMVWGPVWGWDNTTTVPSVNVIEGQTEFVIELAIPGISKEDLCIELENDVLTVRTENTVAINIKGNLKHKEFSYGTICRSIQLPEHVSVERIKATVENGILFISVPKKGFVPTFRIN
jgi:HSP20 family molecular chaperone IbpA